MTRDEVARAIADGIPVRLFGGDLGMNPAMRAFRHAALRAERFTKAGLVRLSDPATGRQVPEAVACRYLVPYTQEPTP